MLKLGIVINGSGGVGKDTLCEFAAKVFRTVNVSSITPIKKIAAANGWRGEKTPEARRFLAELKRVFTEYNDLPNRYALAEYGKFIADPEKQIFFVHIREGEEIRKFVNGSRCFDGSRCVTLLITSKRCAEKYGNASDDMVESYDYDYRFANDGDLAQAEEDFISFLADIVQRECCNVDE
ncbi:MAG: hypothetical protein IKB34_07540 [Clostridia bacterium]|nr:hypothetical protein [Clostridia bacterium]